MTGFQKSGPVYSNISMIKRALHQSRDKALPLYEIVLYLANHWDRIAFAEAENFVDLALKAKMSHFEEDATTGLWTIKQREQSDLDTLYRYMRNQFRLFTVAQLSKKSNHKDRRELLVQLMSDIRFSSLQFGGEEFWMLSEWEFANDLLYGFMQQNRRSAMPIFEVPDALHAQYSLDRESFIFAPEIDPRFRVFGDHVQIELTESGDEVENQEKDIPPEIREEVARSSILICKYLNRIKRADAKNIAINILGVKAYDVMFPNYCKAIHEFLKSMKEYEMDRDECWCHVETFENPGESEIFQFWRYAVYNSVPDVVVSDSTDVPIQFSNPATVHTQKEPAAAVDTSSPRAYSRCLTYYERIKGYLRMTRSWGSFFEGESGRIRILHDQLEYWWSWRTEAGNYFFYGSGVMDFYFDNELEAGRELTMELSLDARNVEVKIGRLNPLFASEQARYLDIGLLVEESKRVKKSFFVLMCDMLASHPSGMHWVRLFEKVNAIRTASRNTISQLLTRNECFVSIENRKGYWKLDVAKLSSCYTNEAGQANTAELELREVPKGSEMPDIPSIQSRPKRKTGHERFPTHWEAFSTWALRQKSLRYETIRSLALSESDFMKLVTVSYSKLLCKLASNRESYSFDKMDLVQEGFWGLIRAVELYSPDQGVPFGHYAKRHALARMLRAYLDHRTLVRIPIHMWDSIKRFELGENKRLQQQAEDFISRESEQESTIIKSYAMQKNIDYLSFEQYWAFVSVVGERECDPPWIHLEGLDEQSLKVVSSDTVYSDDELLEQLDSFCDIMEANSERLWVKETTEYLVHYGDLKKNLDEILGLLKDKERFVIERRFGLANHHEHTLEELGGKLGCTRERVRQIERKALDRLLVHAKKKDLYNYLTLDTL